MAYARVVLPDTEVHQAEAKARTLIDALKAVNHAEPGTWELMKGCILFVNGRRSRFSWGLKEDVMLASRDGQGAEKCRRGQRGKYELSTSIPRPVVLRFETNLVSN